MFMLVMLQTMLKTVLKTVLKTMLKTVLKTVLKYEKPPSHFMVHVEIKWQRPKN